MSLGNVETRTLSVLLVEDSEFDALLTQHALDAAQGGLRFAVTVAGTVAEAVRVLGDQRMDVVLLDLELPDASGFTGLASVVEADPGAAVIVLTGHVDPTLGHEAVKRGAQDYLRKDEVNPAALSQAVEYAVYRKSLTADLLQSEQRFHGLFTDAPVPMYCVGADGRVVDANEVFSAMTGYRRDELVGQHALGLVHPDDADAAVAAHGRLVRGEEDALVFETRLVRKDGAVRHVRVSAGTVRTGAGQVDHVAAVFEDITEARLAQAAVAFQAHLLDCVGQAVIATDRAGRLTYCNDAAARMFGLTPASLGLPVAAVGAAAAPGVHEATLVDARGRPFSALVASTRAATADAAIATADRAATPHSAADRAAHSVADSNSDGLITVVTDVGDLKQAELLLALSEARSRSLIENISDVISLHDKDGRLVYISPSGARLLGRAADDLAGTELITLAHPDDRETVLQAFDRWRRGGSDQVQFRMEGGDGEWIHCESVGKNLTDDPSVAAIVITTRDITERKQAEAALAHQALHDALTGLPNRTLFADRLEHGLARARRSGRRVALLLLDLDNFKLINDSFGHQAGDEVLRAVAKLLETAMRPGDTIARLGGDEFGVVCEGIDSVEQADALAARLLSMLRAPFGVRGHEIHLTTSIGIALSDDGRLRPEDLLQDADVALYRAKDNGRACAAVFDDELKARARRRMLIEEALRGALARNELKLHYQPQIDLSTGRLVGFEALLRWEHPELGRMDADEFIPVIEQTDMIFTVGPWVVEQAAAQLAEWRARHPGLGLGVSVNLSSRQLSDPALLRHLAGVLNRTHVDPGAMCVEITESIVMDDAESSERTLREIKQLGMRIAIDDFGTGYSSLAYLKRFPVDYLKVDRTFVAGLGRDPEDTVIVASVVDLGRSLGLDVVAEGVESPVQLGELLALGCSLAQGFYWSPAVDPAEAESLILDAEQQDGVLAAIPLSVPERVRPVGITGPDDDVLASVTHELRTPITVIRGFAETIGELIRSGRTDVLQSALDAITRQTEGMEHVIASLADARALDAGTLVLDRAPLDFAAAVGEVVDDLRLAFTQHRLVVHADGTAEVDADRQRLRQIVSNLVSNAAKFAPAGSDIDVVVTADPADARVAVIDRGPAVPPDRAGELFRKFSRIDRSKRGTGLGLYLARNLARAHGGDVVYRRAVTGGAEFCLTLPRARPDGAAASGRSQGLVRPAPTRPASPQDGEVTAAVLRATRRLVRAVVPEQAVGAAVGLVAELGGRLVADPADPAALPYDLACGLRDAVYAAADPVSTARARLEAVLPEVLADAAETIPAMRGRKAPRDVVLDRVTGLPMRDPWELEEPDGPMALVLLEVEGLGALTTEGGRGEAARTMRTFGRCVLAAARGWGSAVRWGNDDVALWGPAEGFEPELVDRLRATWERLRPHPVPFWAGVAVAAGPEDPGDMLQSARRALRTAQRAEESELDLSDASDGAAQSTASR